MTFEEILNCYECNEENWRELKDLYLNDRIIPFIGAGVSMPTYSSWSDALKNILSGKEDELNELKTMLSENKYEDASEYVYNTVKKNNFYRRVKQEFSSEKIQRNGLSNIAKILPDVFNGLVFTTNFDKCLEFAYSQSDKGFNNILKLKNMSKNNATTTDSIRSNTHNLYKIHGDIDDLDSLVFLKKEYDTAYGEECFVNAMNMFAYNKTFLFLGCSLEGNDRYIDIIKNNINKLDAGVIKHYAFLSLPEKENFIDNKNYQEYMIDRIRELGSWGIFPIWFPAKQYSAIEILLKHLLKNFEIDEKKSIEGDLTNRPKHFNIFASQHKIKEIFIDKDNEFFWYDSNLKCSEKTNVKVQNVLEIVLNERIVFIEGGYGTGKTTLAKYLQEQLIDKDFKTIFIDSEWFLKHNTVDSILCGIKDEEKDIFIFVDAYDKLIGLGEETLSFIDKNNTKIAKIIKKFSNYHFIINSRPYLKECFENELSEISAQVALNIFYETNISNVPCFITKDFLTGEYNTFFKKIKNTSSKIVLSNEIIKKWNKKAPISCKTPLFAYVIGQYFYEHQGEEEDITKILPENPLDIYEDFVKKTIEGRFAEEGNKSYIDINIRDKYFTILKKIAIQMLHSKRNKINYSEDTTETVFHNKDMFAININLFDSNIKQEIENFLNINENLIASHVINNYFFNVFKDSNTWMVRFSDINVLSCFAAIQYYESVFLISKEIQKNELEEIASEMRKNLSLCELHPQAMDFLIWKLRKMSKEMTDILLHNIRSIIIRYRDNPVASIEEVKMVLVLCIIHIKLEKRSYKSICFEDFFKVFYRVCKTAKALNINGMHKKSEHRFLVERYFMYCKFVDCDFKRLNYKFYNFSYSSIINSNFTQCNFLDNRFDGCELKNVSFSLCMFNEKTNFSSIKWKEKIIFKNCIFQGCSIEKPNLQCCKEIIFEKCSLEKFIIKKCDNCNAKIYFKNCVLSDVSIVDCTKVNIIIDNCIILESGKINVMNSNIYTMEPKFYNLDGKSQFFI